jgi:hypothetical protein
MLNKNYEQLKLWMSVEDYNINIFKDTIVADMIGEYFLVDTGKKNYTISVFQQDDGSLVVLIEEKIDYIWHTVDQKNYKTAKGAFNKIKKSIEEMK